MKHPNVSLSILTVAVAAALAACGGGGGGGGDAETPAPTTPSAGTSTTATGPSGTTLVANTGTSSGAANNDVGTINVNPALPPSPVVPAANQVATSVAAATYAAGSQPLQFFATINDWRSQMRFEEENGGTRLGVGLLSQRANLDTLADSLATSAPGLVSADPATRAAAAVAAQSSMAALGYPISYVVAADSANTIPLAPAQYCTKALMSSLPGAEIAVSGMRYVGLAVPDINVGNCVMVAALESAATWQLPPTGSSSVYPFPGKQLTLPRYYGDWASLGFTSQPGHAVHASLASVDALPVAVAGAGSGQPIATSAITINEFSLRLKSTNAPVASRIFTRAGVVAGTGVTLESTSQLQFPTSIVLIPTAPLAGETVYTATIRAVVNGRTVTRTWDFTTSL